MYNCIKKSRNKCSLSVISIEFYKLKCSRKQNLNTKLTLFHLETQYNDTTFIDK